MKKVLLIVVVLIAFPLLAQRPTDRMIGLLDRMVLTDLQLDSDEHVKRQLADLTLNELWVLENAVYARAGKQFKDKALRGIFNGMDWYRPKKDGFVLSPLDSANLESIASCRKIQQDKFEQFLGYFYPEPLPLDLWEIEAPKDPPLPGGAALRFLGEHPRFSKFFPIARFDIGEGGNGLVYARQVVRDSAQYEYILFTINELAARRGRLVLGQVDFGTSKTVKVATFHADLSITSAALLQAEDDAEKVRHFRINGNGRIKPVVKS